MLTVAYMTSRRDCRIEWFFDSLMRQAGSEFFGMRVVVVDFFAGEREDYKEYRRLENVVWVEPKPTVWQGRHRLTSRNYFAASNARNTAICHAVDGHIAFVDDLSVLLPGWLACVKEAMAEEVTLGRYAKVEKLVVDKGEVISFEAKPVGEDSRYQEGRGPVKFQVSGEWMYGASLVAPVEAFLRINGFDEDCDSMGSEDYICGMMLERAGYRVFYDQRMMTFESEELHHVEPAFARIIKPYVEGVSKFRDKDASHAILNMVRRGRSVAPNYCNLRYLRQFVLNGGEFPVAMNPQHDWRDGQPISEM